MKLCKIDRCYKKHHGHGYCDNHLKQFKKYGYVPHRTIHTPNKFIVDGDFCKIIIYNNKGQSFTYTVIDIKNIQKCKKYKWGLCGDGYIQASIKGTNKKIKLHQLILNTPKGMVSNHIDRNKLNNCEYNLRIATYLENILNRSIQKNNTSGYIGVNKHKCGKWVSRIGKYGSQHYKYLGLFNDKKQAALAYNKAAKQFFGDFATLNEM